MVYKGPGSRDLTINALICQYYGQERVCQSISLTLYANKSYLGNSKSLKRPFFPKMGFHLMLCSRPILRFHFYLATFQKYEFPSFCCYFAYQNT